MNDLMLGFNFADLYSFIHDIILLLLVFRRQNGDAAGPHAKGKRP